MNWWMDGAGSDGVTVALGGTPFCIEWIFDWIEYRQQGKNQFWIEFLNWMSSEIRK